ncbi:MAG: winged helix-turn-helix domain-containing protein [Bacteroidota bacterium]|nr:winged helix-turn-helix domain-containing protein [Bacteroidota bacterium]
MYINTNPFCEPQLGKRGLYPSLGSQTSNLQVVDSLMWLLNMCDGINTLVDIALHSKQDLYYLYKALDSATEQGLIVRAGNN